MRFKQSFKPFLKRLSFYLIVIGVCCIPFATWLFISHFFAIRNIEIIKKNKDFNLNGVTTLSRQNLLILDEKKIADILYEANPTISRITVTKKYPATLIVTIDTFEPFAVLGQTDSFFVLSQDGRVLSKSRQNSLNLPVLTYYQKYPFESVPVGSHLDSHDILTSLYFINLAQTSGYPIISIDIRSENVIALHGESTNFLFSAVKEKALQEYQFMTIAKQFKIEGKKISTIDVRFDKPVVEVAQ
ncbi:hypothetical protein HGB07_05005 [Candidatus Roizmanbacteria bacterium]|nr:hypothetical protein [Candidatus Roizmanbacteria bacterium]